MKTLKDALENAFKDRKDQVITITISPPSKSVETEMEDEEDDDKEYDEKGKKIKGDKITGDLKE